MKNRSVTKFNACCKLRKFTDRYNTILFLIAFIFIVNCFCITQFQIIFISISQLVDTIYNTAGTTTYDAQILSQMKTKLDGLGWHEVTSDSLTGPGLIVVRAGITNSTVTVNNGYNWWSYYGNSWYYPDYYNYSYTYTTGTLVMLMSDYNLADGGKAPIEWSGILNAATGQGTSTPTLITTGINQAFSSSQSPYLYN